MGHIFGAYFRGAVPTNVSGAFDWVDVRDVAEGMLAARDRGQSGQNYLLPGSRASVAELAALCAEAAGVKPPRATLPMWLAKALVPLGERQARRTGAEPLFTREALHALESDPSVNGERASQQLGYRPRPLVESVEDTYRWSQDRASPAGVASASCRNVGDRMMDLGLDAPGLGRAAVPVVPAQVGVDGSVLLFMAGMVGAVEGEATERLELTLDEVQPARIGGQVHQLDVVAGGPNT